MIVSLPALFKVLLIFSVIVIFNRFKLDLGLSILVGTLLLGLWFGQGLSETLVMILQGVTEPLTLMLVLLVSLILGMNCLLELSGGQKRMVNALSGMMKRTRLSLTAFPALIGLLPMPGGAYFSAPMVDQMSRDLPLSPEKKSIINYWFRHIWEFWWPMYPGVITAVTLTGFSVTNFILLQCVYTPVAFLLGYLVLLRGLSIPTGIASEKSATPVKNFLSASLPVWLVLGCVIVLGTLSPLWEGRIVPAGLFSQYIPMFLGLFLALLWIIKDFRGRMKEAASAFFNQKTLQLIFLILAVMAYKNVLNLSGAIQLISGELKTFHIPIMMVVMLLPFLSGMVIGVAVGFVGASFPLVLSLTAGLPHQAAYITLAYGFGYFGMMLSPIHVCLVLTNNYFKGNLSKNYRYLLPLGLGMICFILLWHTVIRTFF
ncbi:MAG: hypothetical protein A2293_13565 [Elusimicrobia bacterium RIFOXYB2_FULL_49_7]|nr:MAG: hypothetical protein A2293_13565 [Elusimicrobia bacterium RIFOXYB2_FULL_49_7]